MFTSNNDCVDVMMRCLVEIVRGTERVRHPDDIYVLKGQTRFRPYDAICILKLKLPSLHFLPRD